MDTSAKGWVILQNRVFRSRRHFMRDFLFDKLARALVWEVNILGLENIPASGPVILMMNHITAVDPVAILGVTRPRFPVPMSKIENFGGPIAGLFARSWGAYPVRRGAVDRRALKATLDLLNAGQVTMIAPEGTRSPALIRPKAGLAYIAVRANPATVIVPTAVYNLETWLRDLLIPWRRTPVHVSYGRGFRLRHEGEGRFPRDVLDRVMDEMMYQLATLLPERNRGVYSDLDAATTDYLDFV